VAAESLGSVPNGRSSGQGRSQAAKACKRAQIIPSVRGLLLSVKKLLRIFSVEKLLCLVFAKNLLCLVPVKKLVSVAAHAQLIGHRISRLELALEEMKQQSSTVLGDRNCFAALREEPSTVSSQGSSFCLWS
jgi:hypothetical protein